MYLELAPLIVPVADMLCSLYMRYNNRLSELETLKKSVKKSELSITDIINELINQITDKKLVKLLILYKVNLTKFISSIESLMNNLDYVREFDGNKIEYLKIILGAHINSISTQSDEFLDNETELISELTKYKNNKNTDNLLMPGLTEIIIKLETEGFKYITSVEIVITKLFNFVINSINSKFDEESFDILKRELGILVSQNRSELSKALNKIKLEFEILEGQSKISNVTDEKILDLIEKWKVHLNKYMDIVGKFIDKK